jgi:hypothetical protein
MRAGSLAGTIASSVAVILLSGAAYPAWAQRITIAPNVGVYIPTTELVKAANGEEFKQEVSITLGGRLGLFFGQRVGLEFTGAYAPSDLRITATGLGDQKADANIFAGSGRLTFQVVPLSSPVAFLVSGGVGVINRSGAFYQDVDKKTDVGGTAGRRCGFGSAACCASNSTPTTTSTRRRRSSRALPTRTRRRRTTCISR